MFERLFNPRSCDRRSRNGSHRAGTRPTSSRSFIMARSRRRTLRPGTSGSMARSMLPFTLTWEQFKALPRKTVHTDIHCVTRWSKLDTDWEGVPIQEIIRLAQVRPSATHVVAHSEQGYTANLPLSILDDDDVMLADTFGASRSSSSTASRSGSSSRSTISGRTRSGSVASISSTTTSSASGNAPATTTMPTPGKRTVQRVIGPGSMRLSSDSEQDPAMKPPHSPRRRKSAHGRRRQTPDSGPSPPVRWVNGSSDRFVFTHAGRPSGSVTRDDPFATTSTAPGTTSAE